MTDRERWLEALLFGSPDRVPFVPGGPRESTLRAWHAQGLDPEASFLDVVQRRLQEERRDRGLEAVPMYSAMPRVDYGVSFRMIPTFEEKVLEHRNGHYIVQDWMGAVTEISDEYDYTYIRNAYDFVTRRWHKWPVQSRADWERMAERFDARHPERFPVNFEERCAEIRDRDYFLEVWFNGPFWQLREFCGFEGLCTLMLEDPDFVEEMAAFWCEFVSQVLRTILELAPPDGIHISEDMAYKEHPMIGPEMTQRFCAPAYRRWVEEARAAGVQVFAVDSDGRPDLLIPVWLECGINSIDPMEVAAGVDLPALRQAYGKQLSFRGGVDKRAIARGARFLVEEMERLQPVLATGGFVPSCDHGVPPDISWRNFQDYSLHLAARTGWLS